MAVLRVAHVWGTRLLDVRHIAGAADRVCLDGTEVDVVPGKTVPSGDTAYVFTWVEAERRVTRVPDDRDWGFAKLVACLVLLASASVAMFSLQAEFGFADRDDPLSRLGPTLAKTTFAPPPPPKKMNLDAAVKAEAKPLVASTQKSHAALKAKNAGLLGALDELKGVEALFAPGGMSPGIQNALNNLKGGGDVGDSSGLQMGPRGFGPVGPGVGLGIGGPGFAARPGPGGPVGGTLTRKISVSPCCAGTKVSDGLSKEVVARVIRLHFSEIKFCYEQALQQAPALNGKVLVQFVIDGTGAVSDAVVAEETIGAPNVEACILSRIRRWRFPEPSGGGVVSITHPWFFKPAGSED